MVCLFAVNRIHFLIRPKGSVTIPLISDFLRCVSYCSKEHKSVWKQIMSTEAVSVFKLRERKDNSLKKKPFCCWKSSVKRNTDVFLEMRNWIKKCEESFLITHIFLRGFTYMSHFAYACKMRCPLNLVLENSEYLWFYWTFCIVILDCGLKLHKLLNHTLVMLQKWLEIH